MKDSIITLENGVNYYILDDLDMNGRKYIIGSMIKIFDQTIDEENLLVNEVVKVGDSYSLITIENQKEAEEITKLLLSKMKSDKN